MRQLAIKLLAVVALALSTSRMASAAVILDQSCCATSNISSQISSGVSFAQTFTVGLAGRLTAAEVDIFFDTSSGSVVFDIVPILAPGATPATVGTPFASATLAWSSMSNGQYRLLDFSAANLQVFAGQQLALVTRPAVVGAASWYGVYSVTDSYVGGGLFGAVPALGPAYVDYSNRFGAYYDYRFRTYVEPIPEPGSLTLLAAGALAALLRSRRSRL